MTTRNTERLNYRPNRLIKEAILSATVDFTHTETYTGTWTRSNTLRKLIRMPYIPYEYSVTSPRTELTSVSLTKGELEEMTERSPKFNNESQIGYVLRVIVSALLQLGYIDYPSTSLYKVLENDND